MEPSHDDLMKMMKKMQAMSLLPNLARIPGDGDGRAQAVLRRAPDTISAAFLQSLDEDDCQVLARYGARQPTFALRRGSVTLLRDALLAAAIGQVARLAEARDMMVGLALHHVVAQKLGAAPPAVFSEVAARLPDGPVPDLLRVFGARQDITLRAFGWQLIETPDGPDFLPD